MDNLELAKLLRKIAAAYTILGENRFKIIAYENAATGVEHATSEIKDLWEEGKLGEVPGLGAAISGHLEELFRTGKSKHFASVLKKINPAVFPLLDVPGLGPKKSFNLVKELKFNNPKTVIGDLEKAIKAGRAPGYLLDGIKQYQKAVKNAKRMSLPEADAIADQVIAYLGQRIDKLGSLRRQVATIGDIDLAIATNAPQEVLKRFVAYPKKINVVEEGPTGATLVLVSGRQVDLRVAKPAEYGAILQYFTGSKYHNIKLRELALKKGLSLNEYGISGHKFATEKDFYNYLGLDYIPPELREDAGEIEAALRSAQGKPNGLPNLVQLSDIKGDLQMHSSFGQQTSHDSGIDSVPQMQAVGKNLGYEYIGVSDHNPSLSKHNPKEIHEEMKKRRNYFEHINSSGTLPRVLNLLEVDIQVDGSLPIDNGSLAELDGCLVGIHSSFRMSKDEATKRVLRGFSHPVARILAHPTGRLLGKREGFDLDWEVIFRFCLEHDKALEINAFPNRLDLPDTLVREAVKRGVKLSLGTDAHCKEDLNLMKYGVSVARRGWAEAKNIINTWSDDKVLTWIHKRS